MRNYCDITNLFEKSAEIVQWKEGQTDGGGVYLYFFHSGLGTNEYFFCWPKRTVCDSDKEAVVVIFIMVCAIHVNNNLIIIIIN